MAVEVKKIVLSVGGKEIELSLADAKELKRVLNDAFPDGWTYETWTTDKIPYTPAGTPILTAEPHMTYLYAPDYMPTITSGYLRHV